MPQGPVISLEMSNDGVLPAGEDLSLASASARLPRGAYSTLRTYGARGVVRFAAHLARLEDSVARQGRAAAIDAGGARRLASEALRIGGHPESRLRLTFAPPRLFASVEAFLPLPRSRYQEGVACLTVALHRDQPRVKDTDFVSTARRAYRDLPPGIEEGLLLAEDGSILEGLSSNFFAVLDGRLRTEEERVLPGITRALVLEVVGHRLALDRRAPRRPELPRVTEAFITSASRGVLPVARIDGAAVGEGRPGPHTRAIMRAFDALVRREAEPL